MDGTKIIPASGVGYTVGTIAKLGSATATGTDRANISTAVGVVTATAVTGPNSASWNPTINVAVPSNALAGTYTATITHSVS